MWTSKALITCSRSSQTKTDLNISSIKNELLKDRRSESPNCIKNYNETINNFGFYSNTSYSRSKPKRAGTTLSSYQEEVKRKRTIKKLREKINLPNSSSSAAAALYPQKQVANDSLNVNNVKNYKFSAKGNEKVLLPVNDFLIHTRADQANVCTINDAMRDGSSTRKK